MKLSATIELVWNLAAQEAIAGQYETIGPEHFLAALLKFAELPVEEVDKAAAGPEVAEQLKREVAAVKEELAGRAIDSEATRHRLRERLGTGSSPYKGGVIHRSSRSKRMFEEATKLAEDSREQTLTARHLLVALLTSPTEAIAEVLGNAVGPSAAKPSDTPVLNELGQDLVRMAAEGRLPDAPECEVQSKALLQTLLQADRRSVLLVCESDAAVRPVLAAAAHAVAARKLGQATAGKRIIDMTAAEPRGENAKQAIERLVSVVNEAAKAEEVILFLPAIESPAAGDDEIDWAELLKGLLSRRPVQCICRVSPKVFRGHMEKDAAWRRLARPMWVHEGLKGDVPNEL